ncbi:MAG: Zn-dependent hydrolase [Clostridia bacterium]|nr:Zn-dependent hydrolase [Clostridia bacterium]
MGTAEPAHPEEVARLGGSPDSLAARLAALAEIGADPGGGLTRLAYTEPERAAHALVAGWMRRAGLAVYEDAVGNLFGRWLAPGADPEAPPVWAGSHLDTVSHGGRFDGAAGVVAALSAVERLSASRARLARPVEVVAFVGEEGSRFPGLLGSRAVALGLTQADLEARDADGIPLRDALSAWGFDPARAGEAHRPPGSVSAYLELHIEQGPVLERAGFAVGLVTGIAGPLELEGEVVGRADHAGTTPMDERRDSLLAVAELALCAERLARESSPQTVATVGRVDVSPGAANVVPGRALFTLDLRDVDLARRDRVEARLRQAFSEILVRRGLEGSFRQLLRVDPVPVPESTRALLGRAARRAGVAYLELPSGAAHDAMLMARLCPAGMIFVRSLGGRSHAPDEETREGDLLAGTEVLFEALRELAGDAELPPG